MFTPFTPFKLEIDPQHAVVIRDEDGGTSVSASAATRPRAWVGSS